MKIIKRFENRLGYTEVQEHGDCFVCVVKSDFAEISNRTVCKFKPEAMASFQFHQSWLEKNEKNMPQ